MTFVLFLNVHTWKNFSITVRIFIKTPTLLLVKWADVEIGVPQRFTLCPLMFLIYINNLPDNLSTNAKLYADNNSLFSVLHDITTSSCDLNYDLNRVREWVFQSKMSFNPEPSKKAQEFIFTRKLQKKVYHYILITVLSKGILECFCFFGLDFQEH